MQINNMSNTITTGSKRYKAVRSKILAQLADLKRKELERKRFESKAVNPTVQMSIRMDQEKEIPAVQGSL